MCLYFFFVFKQKTAYELRISDWSSDVCSSDLAPTRGLPQTPAARGAPTLTLRDVAANFPALRSPAPSRRAESAAMTADQSPLSPPADAATLAALIRLADALERLAPPAVAASDIHAADGIIRSEEHRVGKAGVRRGGIRCATHHQKKKK